MPKLIYDGREGFLEDQGTFQPFGNSSEELLDISGLSPRKAKRRLKDCPKDRPLVWFIDDERANREWFRDHHRNDFSTLTFSSRAHFAAAFQRKLRCDAIVTDIFFPSKTGKQRDTILIYRSCG